MNHAPLAEQLRPQSLEAYIGQEHLTGPNAILGRSIVSGNIPSMILWGPPGVGKTTLAHIISKTLKREFYTLSAISSGVKDVRQVISQAGMFAGSAILFIDEIHRFSKSQQDSLLGAVEKGTITLIGATTENPSFEVISPLLSRCQVYILKPLEKQHLEILIDKGIAQLSAQFGIEIKLIEKEALIGLSGGDARKLFNALELVVYQEKTSSNKIEITNELVKQVIQENLATYDKQGEMHYDIISAFIKSMRGSDPNAAVYWLARMIEGGEDPKFIARRMLILASEDIGNANPNALLLANACFDAIAKIGWPEGRIILSQTAVYLANSAKSNSTYMAIKEAQSIVQKTGNLPVPLHLRNAPTKLMKDIGYGKEYEYAHQHPGNFVELEFLPKAIQGNTFYEPGNNPRENEDRKRMKDRWKTKYHY
ncbi:MAG: AAA family ATPase [Bacteroidetes bacterium CG18_big_fil_WC_8_21_14_2_50_41_14]|nr:MAG: AAA family ATPase [Bacteroidetes bacterium CG18_big_fil_WC_8_21_14_2_50_41_14]PJB58217.1 MAG: AAA family ATPase [Bacteroidetes bacterium CG_4_9_14_3_um_filter_41_19]